MPLRKNPDPESFAVLREVRRGAMAITQINVHRVKLAWARILEFNHLLKQAGLAWLPDPENACGEEALQDLENWLAKAYSSKDRSEATWKKLLEKIRQEFLEAQHEEEEQTGPADRRRPLMASGKCLDETSK
jgi:hypothetical protein